MTLTFSPPSLRTQRPSASSTYDNQGKLYSSSKATVGPSTASNGARTIVDYSQVEPTTRWSWFGT
jgi:hypothetical protein